jgi:DNA repair protein RadC
MKPNQYNGTYAGTPSQTSFIGRDLQLKPPPNLIAESRARLQFYGPGVLSQAELLSMLVGNGSELWQQYRSLAAIARAPRQELTSLPGIGEATVCRLKAALELARRLVQEEHGDRPQITGPTAAADLVMLEMRDLEQEHLRVLLLDTKNRVLEIVTIYIGNVNSSIIRASEVIRPAVRLNATAILVHNHPSGDPTPSPEDVQVTCQIVEAGLLLGIEVLDHLIIGDNQFVSLRERGLGFGSADDLHKE